MSLKQSIKEILGSIYFHLYKKYQPTVGNRVILYHSIGSKLDHDSYGISISEEKFKEHMKYIKENYNIISIDKNYSNVLDKNSISLTFDDGYKDNLKALDICEKHEIPFTLYITTHEIGKENYLSRDDILRFSNSTLCTLGAHSHTHPLLASLSYNEQLNELTKSKQILEDIIGSKITHMSYPHGSYNEDTLKIIEELGYQVVTSSHIGLNTTNNLNMKKIKRIEIVGSDDLKSLRKKILGYYDFLAWKE